MPTRRRSETDYKIFVAGLKDHPDDLIISMAVMNRVVTPMARHRKASRNSRGAGTVHIDADSGFADSKKRHDNGPSMMDGPCR